MSLHPPIKRNFAKEKLNVEVITSNNRRQELKDIILVSIVNRNKDEGHLVDGYDLDDIYEELVSIEKLKNNNYFIFSQTIYRIQP